MVTVLEEHVGWKFWWRCLENTICHTAGVLWPQKFHIKEALMSHLLPSLTSGRSMFTQLLLFIEDSSNWCSRSACRKIIMALKNRSQLSPQHLPLDQHREGVW